VVRNGLNRVNRIRRGRDVDAVGERAIETSGKPVSGARAPDGPRDAGVNVGLFQGGIVERRPSLWFGQHLVAHHPTRVPCRVHDQAVRDFHVEAQPVVAPRARPSRVEVRHVDDCRPPDIALGDEHATGREKATARIDDRRDMSLVPGQSASEIGDDHIGALGQDHVCGEALDELDPVGASVRGGDLLRQLDDVVRLDRVHTMRSQTARHERKNASTCADVDHDRARFDGLTERPHEGAHSDVVGDHRAVVRDLVHPTSRPTVRPRNTADHSDARAR
jgi:hypothetical protein